MADLRSDFRERLSRVRWVDFDTAYGNAGGASASASAAVRVDANWGSVGDQLWELASVDLSKALTASNRLWAGLCHQHAYLSSAALPALPFLLEILEVAPEPVAVEILDILVGFAECSRSQEQGWAKEIRNLLVMEGGRFVRLARSDNPDISQQSRAVLDGLGLAP